MISSVINPMMYPVGTVLRNIDPYPGEGSFIVKDFVGGWYIMVCGEHKLASDVHDFYEISYQS